MKHDLLCEVCSAKLGEVERPTAPEQAGLICQSCVEEARAALAAGEAASPTLYQRFSAWFSSLFG